MFTEEVLEEIFRNEEVQKVPIGCQSTMVRAIEKIIEERNKKNVPIFESDVRKPLSKL